MQILQNGARISSRPAPPAGVRRILRATPPAAGPHSRGVGCGVLAVLCWLGWLAGLGWAGDAGKDELGRLGWPGQAGWACLYTFSCFVVVVVCLVWF